MTNTKKSVAKALPEVTTAATAAGNITEELNYFVKPEQTIKSKKAILAKIDSMTVSLADWTKDMQILAVSCVEHSLKHGDITVITPLLKALEGSAIYTNALCAYFEKYCCVNFEKDEETKKIKPVYSREKRDEMMKSGWFEAAATNMWHKAAKQPVYVPFNLEVQLDKIINMAMKRKDKGEVDTKQLAEVVRVRDAIHREAAAAKLNEATQEVQIVAA